MTKVELPYIKAYKDRHGKRRHYYRRPGCPVMRLPGEPGSSEFLEAYKAATESAPREIGVDRNKPGSFGALIAVYYKSADFKNLKESTRHTRRNDVERFRKQHGEMSVKAIQRKHITAMLDAIEAQSKSSKSLRRILGVLMTLAQERGWRDDNPMVGMRRQRKPTEGFRAWSEEDIAKFEEAHQTGSRERLALALLLYTGQRRSDVVTMGRQHVKDGKIRVVQQKTGTELWIKLHSRLKAEIAAAPKDHLTFLTTQYGKPFSAAGFTNWFTEKADKAGLPENSTPHGLRKAAARRLAEAGCTEKQIMAVTGHKSLSEVTHYTASADQEKLAGEAIDRVEAGTSASTPENPNRLTGQNAQ
jgi:integrase